MENQLLMVEVNGIAVYQEEVKASHSMMRGHQLRKKFCIDSLKANGISGGVYVYKEQGMVEVVRVEYDGVEGVIIAQSKMNSADYSDGDDWFDDLLIKDCA